MDEECLVHVSFVSGIVFVLVCDKRLGGEEQTSHRCRILQCRTGHLGWVDNTGIQSLRHYIRTVRRNLAVF